MKNTNPNPKWGELHELIEKTAIETIGYREKKKHNQVDDPQLLSMSLEQQSLRVETENSSNVENIMTKKEKENAS